MQRAAGPTLRALAAVLVVITAGCNPSGSAALPAQEPAEPLRPADAAPEAAGLKRATLIQAARAEAQRNPEAAQFLRALGANEGGVVYLERTRHDLPGPQDRAEFFLRRYDAQSKRSSPFVEHPFIVEIPWPAEIKLDRRLHRAIFHKGDERVVVQMDFQEATWSQIGVLPVGREPEGVLAVPGRKGFIYSYALAERGRFGVDRFPGPGASPKVLLPMVRYELMSLSSELPEGPPMAWPDRDHLAYVQTVGVDENLYNELWLLELATGRRRRLADSKRFASRLSMDSRTLRAVSGDLLWRGERIER